MAQDPSFAALVRVGAAVLTTGDTSRTAPTTYVTFFTAGASGSRCERISLAAQGATVASTIRLFWKDGSGSFRLFHEVQVPAVTPGSGVTVWELTLEAVTLAKMFPKLLPTTWSLVATVNDTQTPGIVIAGEGGDF